MTAVLDVNAVRAEALFTSALSAGTRPSRAEVDAAIRDAVRAHGGTKGCTDDMATEFGEHPELAVSRMRWARDVVAATYPRRTVTEP